MDNGYIKLHRKIYDSYLASSPYRIALWIALLVKASHKDNKFIFNGVPKEIKRGQFITGRKRLSQVTAISESYVEKILSEFEKEGMIRQQKTNRNRLITIVKYNDYQDCDNKKTTEYTTERQRRDTINNDKNEKNIYIGTHKKRSSFTHPSLEEVKEYFIQRRTHIDPEAFFAHYEANGWVQGKNKPVKNWKACLTTWEKNNPRPQKEDYFKGKKML